jgi:hypothetical protein
MVAEVVYAGYVRVVAETGHSLGFTKDTGSAGLIQFLGFNQVDSDVPVEYGVVGEIDFLLPTFTEFLLDLITAISEGNRFSSRGSGFFSGDYS